MYLFDILKLDFIQYALISIFLLSISAPILGIFLLLRRLSFFGAGLSHLSFAGIALGFLLKKDPVLVSSIFTSIIGTLSYYIYIKTFVPPDILISILFSLGLALAVFILGISHTLGSNIFSYLFGSILLLTKKDIFFSFILTFLIIVYFLIFRKKLIISLLSREIGKVQWNFIDLIEIGFIFLSSIFVVFTIKLIGIILSTSFIVIPSLFGLMFGRSFISSIVYGIIFSIISGVSGLILSVYLNVPPGGTIVLTMIVFLKLFYFFNYLFNSLFKKTLT